MINLNYSSDPKYRYKMPEFNITNAGKGNGLYTIFNNINDICKAINQPTEIVFKFIASYFGANSNEEKKSITGNFKIPDLHKPLKMYIDRFVFCPNCNIPELIPSFEKNRKEYTLKVKCSACCKESIIEPRNKYEEKGKELIIKYLEKESWPITKGNLVVQNKDEHQTNVEDEYNPFI